MPLVLSILRQFPVPVLCCSLYVCSVATGAA